MRGIRQHQDLPLGRQHHPRTGAGVVVLLQELGIVEAACHMHREPAKQIHLLGVEIAPLAAPMHREHAKREAAHEGHHGDVVEIRDPCHEAPELALAQAPDIRKVGEPHHRIRVFEAWQLDDIRLEVHVVPDVVIPDGRITTIR